MTRLLVWRHGNTDYNAGGRVQGQTDTPLNARGRDQAAEAAALLASMHPDALVSSDLSRAHGTASALASLTGLSVTLDPRLRERHFGEWQGMLLTDIEALHPTEHARWKAGDPSPGCGIESLDDLAKRMLDALQDAAALAPGGTVVVTTHGGAARQGCGALLGWPNEATRTLGSLHNCHWTELRERPSRRGGTRWRLMAHNVGVLSQS